MPPAAGCIPPDGPPRPTLEELRAKYGPNWGIGQTNPPAKPIPWSEQVKPWEDIAISPDLGASLGRPNLTAEQRKVVKPAKPAAA